MAEPKFLPVSVTASPVEIELPNGTVVRLPVGVGQAVIVDVIEHPEAILQHRLEEARTRAATKSERRKHRRKMLGKKRR